MTNEEAFDAVRVLRSQGFAVALFTPDEYQDRGIERNDLEEQMVIAGNEHIDMFGEPLEDEEEDSE